MSRVDAYADSLVPHDSKKERNKDVRAHAHAGTHLRRKQAPMVLGGERGVKSKVAVRQPELHMNRAKAQRKARAKSKSTKAKANSEQGRTEKKKRRKKILIRESKRTIITSQSLLFSVP